MIITMSYEAGKKEIERVKAKVQEIGYKYKVFHGETKTVIHVIGVTDRDKLRAEIEPLPKVENMVPIMQPFKMASREFHAADTEIDVNGVTIGGNKVVIMAGPCAVEEGTLFKIAEEVKQAGGHFLRGGAFKPRTSPYSFHGLGKKGLELLAEARKRTGLSIITEVISETDVPIVADYTDILQIGARNMQNFALLKAVGRMNNPVLLKRGMSASIEDWLMAAEYILSEGNRNVILCERGIKTFERYTRNTLDISSIPVIKHLSHLPVVVDPSHAAGYWRYVGALAKAGVAAGADGLIIEVHTDPAQAVSDGKQSLKPDTFNALMGEIRNIAVAVGRSL